MLFQYNIIFQPYQSFKHLSSTRGWGWGIDICARILFCTKFNSEQLLFEAFFHVGRIFGGIEPQSKFTFPLLYIVIFQWLHATNGQWRYGKFPLQNERTWASIHLGTNARIHWRTREHEKLSTTTDKSYEGGGPF